MAIIDYNLARLVADNVYGRTSGGLHGSIPSGWVLDTTFNSLGAIDGTGNAGELRLGNGIYAYALKSIDPNDNRRILAFRGTEDARDWLANFTDIGESQFTPEAKKTVNQWMAEQLVASKRVELVGHSLGGALVQWAINDRNMQRIDASDGLNSVLEIARTLPDPVTGNPNQDYQINPSFLHFTTFNAPSIRLSPGGLQSGNTTTVVAGEHHVIAVDFALPTPGLQGDFMHLLGGRAVGGTIVAHRVDFTQFSADGNIYDAHQISKPWWNAPIDTGHVPPFAIDLQKAQVVGRFVADLLGPSGQVNGAVDALKIGLVLGAGLTAGTAFQFGTQLSQLIQGVGADLQAFATRLVAPGTDGFQDGFSYLLDLAHRAGRNVATFTFDLSAAALTTWKAIAGLSGAVITVGVEQLENFIADTAHGIGNAFSDWLNDVPNVFNLDRTLGFTEYQNYANAYDQVLQDRTIDSALRAALEDAQQIVQQAGQTVVIQTGVGPNPFETPGFTPDAAPPATATVNEGQLEMFTIHLPFEAGAGGQKLTLTLGGPNANGFVLRTNGSELSPNGSTFTLTIPEGQQQLVVGLKQTQDIGTSSAFTVTAQLVDAKGAETHAPDQELTIALADTGDLLDGHVPVIDYDNSGPVDTVIGNDGANIIGSPAFGASGLNSMYLSGLDGPDQLRGGARNDEMFGGEGSDWIRSQKRLSLGAGDDRLDGGAGDDVLMDNHGRDVLRGGEGRDGLIGDEANESSNDYLDGGDDADELWGKGGDDVLLGGTGDDHLLGDDASSNRDRPVGADYLDGGEGADVLLAGLGDDQVRGGGGNDRLYGDNIPGGLDRYNWSGMVHNGVWPGFTFLLESGARPASNSPELIHV